MGNRHEVNNAKRAEIARLVNAAFAKGWTVHDLALACFVDRSTIRAWAKGRNMGTNTIRDWLATLPPRQSPEGRAALIERVTGSIGILRTEVDWAMRGAPVDTTKARGLSAEIGAREARIAQVRGEV